MTLLSYYTKRNKICIVLKFRLPHIETHCETIIYSRNVPEPELSLSLGNSCPVCTSGEVGSIPAWCVSVSAVVSIRSPSLCFSRDFFSPLSVTTYANIFPLTLLCPAFPFSDVCHSDSKRFEIAMLVVRHSLIRLLARSLAPLTHSLASHCPVSLARSAALTRPRTHSLLSSWDR